MKKRDVLGAVNVINTFIFSTSIQRRTILVPRKNNAA